MQMLYNESEREGNGRQPVIGNSKPAIAGVLICAAPRRLQKERATDHRQTERTAAAFGTPPPPPPPPPLLLLLTNSCVFISFSSSADRLLCSAHSSTLLSAAMSLRQLAALPRSGAGGALLLLLLWWLLLILPLSLLSLLVLVLRQLAHGDIVRTDACALGEARRPGRQHERARATARSGGRLSLLLPQQLRACVCARWLRQIRRRAVKIARADAHARASVRRCRYVCYGRSLGALSECTSGIAIWNECAHELSSIMPLLLLAQRLISMRWVLQGARISMQSTGEPGCCESGSFESLAHLRLHDQRTARIDTSCVERTLQLALAIAQYAAPSAREVRLLPAGCFRRRRQSGEGVMNIREWGDGP